MCLPFKLPKVPVTAWDYTDLKITSQFKQHSFERHSVLRLASTTAKRKFDVVGGVISLFEFGGQVRVQELIALLQETTPRIARL